MHLTSPLHHDMKSTGTNLVEATGHVAGAAAAAAFINARETIELLRLCLHT